MPAGQPFLRPEGMCNVADKEEFTLNLVFGASSIASQKGKGPITAARNSAGNYTITLPRSYRRRISFTHGWGKLAAGAVLFPVILTDSSATASAPTMVMEIRTEAGVATDPASGSELDVVLAFSLNTLND